jgi:hypothetical protein
MMSFLKNLFARRPSRFERFRGGVNNHRGGVALGALASIAAPFVIKKVRTRMAQRQAQPQGAAY